MKAPVPDNPFLDQPHEATLLRNFISFYHQAYRGAVWSSRHNFRDIYGS